MKILYGVQGTGNGHIARARAMSHAFKAQNVDVDFLFSGRDKAGYFSMEDFGDYQTRRGLTFCTEKGKVNHLKTAMNTNPNHLWKEVSDIDLSGYDVVLNDFEPITAWAAKKQKVPTVGISHQNAFRYSVPKKGATWLDQTLIEHFAPTEFHLGLHWYHFQQPILPPIVHTSFGLETQKLHFILVYLPFEDLEEVSQLLQRFSNHEFICYHPSIKEAYQQEHLTFMPLSYDSFQQHLHACQGVIANGGFELPSEALTLGKKLLLKPLAGQFEQMSNVATLESLGLASSMNWMDPSSVRTWLDEQPAEKVIYPDVAAAIAEWVTQGDWKTITPLWSDLWEQVDFPHYALINE
ncbi:MJ1255/VC2487 family glycosyltransferase [Vibrio rumoiensis]|uniref:Glycosyltransferase n=1 Tax=Vibrio rumoiensis 1S-45 TaxID=1188252 RepID=A0A1E5DZM9_9VIBR|nr:MJ1255/VC2487 family glycosyltransferase [Vibrio rumoiensis]OEF22962.1 glycosyltransferase [Vibrio rumoiensis 1S-45]